MALVDSAPVRGSRERAAGLVAPAEIGSVRRTAVESAPGASMRPVMTRRYKMSGRVRPLLFWIGKDDIGIARIVWRRGNGAAVGYELLVGTDPAKAPRSLNRWGYIAEDVEGADGSTLALMTGADEATYNEAASNSGRPPGAGDFRAIQAHVERGAATWQTARVSTPSALTVHDVDAALERIRHETAAAPSRGMPLPSGARPGFLTAVAELIDLAVTGVNRKADTRELLRPQSSTCSGRVRTKSTCERWSLCKPITTADSFRPFERRSRSARSPPTPGRGSRSRPDPRATFLACPSRSPGSHGGGCVSRSASNRSSAPLKDSREPV